MIIEDPKIKGLIYSALNNVLGYPFAKDAPPFAHRDSHAKIIYNYYDSPKSLTDGPLELSAEEVLIVRDAIEYCIKYIDDYDFCAVTGLRKGDFVKALSNHKELLSENLKYTYKIKLFFTLGKNKNYFLYALLLITGLAVHFWMSESNTQKASACKEIAAARFELDAKNTKDISELLMPVYGWSKKYKTCIYFGGIMKFDVKEGVAINHYVKDLYADKDLVAYQETLIPGKEESSEKNFTIGNQEILDSLSKEIPSPLNNR